MPEHPEHGERTLRVRSAKTHAAGVRGVGVAMHRALTQMGPGRSAVTLKRLNQADGFDCMSCPWPDPDPEHRNGAEFLAGHSIAWLDRQPERWLGQQGRLTHPMVKWPGSTHYAPIPWDEAYTVVAGHLNGLTSPDEAVFYTPGRASNEAAFVYQLFARAYGTNNLPDCSNMCHESTGGGGGTA